MNMQLKPGDLVMVVKPAPCCGDTSTLGHIFTVTHGHVSGYRCNACGVTAFVSGLIPLEGKYCAEPERLKKIDPPATGDSLPTRAEKEQKV